MPPRFAFTIAATDASARTGTIQMARGTIRTPAFMPVGTAATVKGLRAAEVAAAGADILLGNTYHLMLRPGAERIARLGGLHHFMNWPQPILTDSGGYQVMSLAALTKRDEHGVAFASHLDGSRHLLTPERSIEIQQLLGSDIVMAFDELIALPAPREAMAAAMHRSMRWAARSREAFDSKPNNSALFGIQQGGLDQRLRAESATALMGIGFDGYAIGGLAVGEGQPAMFAVLDYACNQLPENAPRYLMGVGKPDDIVGAVIRGVDMFDCVLPTRSGRNGQAFTHDGPLNIRNAAHAEALAPLDPDCPCPVCTGPQAAPRAYLHHLVKSKEMLGAMLMTQHNIGFYQHLMASLRAAITTNTLTPFAAQFLARYHARHPGGVPPVSP